MSELKLPSFQACEIASDTIAAKIPGSPRQEVMLTRLYYHIQPFMSAYFNEALKAYGMNETTWMALMVLYSQPEPHISPSDLSAALAFSRTNATRVVDDLCERGLMRREPSQQDRRKTELWLTDAGEAFIHEVMPLQRERLRQLWTDFSEEEKQLLDGLLRKLLQRLGG